MTAPLAFTAGAVALALLGSCAWSAYAVWVELREIRVRLDRVGADQRAVRLQVANMIAMLFRAGFKRGPTHDWSDDGQETQALGHDTDTQWDWRRRP